jgi:transcriptional regulator with XRE-family HTH domain
MISHFSCLLKRRREEMGWTQKELAAVLGKSESYISLLESGTRRPSERTARMLARILYVDESEMDMEMLILYQGFTLLQSPII